MLHTGCNLKLKINVGFLYVSLSFSIVGFLTGPMAENVSSSTGFPSNSLKQ